MYPLAEKCQVSIQEMVLCEENGALLRLRKRGKSEQCKTIPGRLTADPLASVKEGKCHRKETTHMLGTGENGDGLCRAPPALKRRNGGKPPGLRRRWRPLNYDVLVFVVQKGLRPMTPLRGRYKTNASSSTKLGLPAKDPQDSLPPEGLLRYSVRA